MPKTDAPNCHWRQTNHSKLTLDTICSMSSQVSFTNGRRETNFLILDGLILAPAQRADGQTDGEHRFSWNWLSLFCQPANCIGTATCFWLLVPQQWTRAVCPAVLVLLYRFVWRCMSQTYFWCCLRISRSSSVTQVVSVSLRNQGIFISYQCSQRTLGTNYIHLLLMTRWILEDSPTPSHLVNQSFNRLSLFHAINHTSFPVSCSSNVPSMNQWMN